MESTDTTERESSERRSRPGRLVRPVEGRMIAGVAKGVGDNFGISEWIPRIFFLVTLFMGGLGIVLYAAGWAFIRSEDEEESPAERFFSGGSGPMTWIGVAFIVLAGIIVLDNFTILAGEVIWAAALLVVGLLLYMGYIPGGSKKPDAGTVESKEGVQQMTTTESQVTNKPETATGDSPAGGVPTPPPPRVPTPPTPPALPAPRTRESSILGRLTIGAMLLAMGILAVLDNIDSVPIAAQPRHYVALAVTILGIGLLIGSIAGRARWLMIIGALLIPTLLFSPVFEYDWDSEAFDLRVTPVEFTDLESSYSTDIGQIRIDLTALDWEGETVELDAEVDIGQLTIIVPGDVGLMGTADVNIGSVRSGNRTSAGLGSPAIEFDESGTAGEVIFDAHVDIGDIDIVRRQP